MTETVIESIILVILLFLSAFFSSAETALTTVSKIKMRKLSEEGSKRADLVLKVTDNKNKLLSAILIGNNIVNLSASSLATMVALRLLGSYGAGISTGILTFLVLIFGEIAPKSMAAYKAEALSLRYVKIISFLMTILTPIIFVINHIAWGILRLFGLDPDTPPDVITEDEIRTIVDVSHESGAIEPEEKIFIHNIFDFTDATAKEIMIPRIDMTMVSVDWSYEKLLEVFKTDMITRMPVYEDDTDHIIGILNMKDLLLPREGDFSIRNHLRDPFFTYEKKSALDLFLEMRDNSQPMAIVLDEYGQVAGLVTLEDLLEELVGEIRDEYDEDEVDDIICLDPEYESKYEVLGSVNLEDLCRELPLNFESEDYDTLGGFLIGEFDHFPEAGETYVSSDGVILKVTSVLDKRIEKVLLRFPENIKAFKERLKEEKQKETNE